MDQTPEARKASQFAATFAEQRRGRSLPSGDRRSVSGAVSRRGGGRSETARKGGGRPVQSGPFAATIRASSARGAWAR